MRPIRAFAGLLILLAVWIGWRLPALREEYAVLTAPTLGPVAKTVTSEAMEEAGEEIAVVEREPLPSPRAPAPMTVRQGAAMPLETKETVVAVAAVEPPPVVPITLAEVVVKETAEPAAEAYRALAAGERRTAARAFRQALGETPGDPRAAAWRVQLAAIEKRWSGSAYAFLRDSGASALAAAPVLGGGQSGAQIGYSLDPLARRPIEVIGRVTAPNADLRDQSQAAVGLSWRISPALSVTAERLVAAGKDARSAWTVRAAGGAATDRSGRPRWLDASVYAEAGAVGARNTATYGAAQGRIGVARARGQVIVAAGAGLWASVQHDRTTVSRAEVGPTIRARLGHFEASADYRVRVAGNAAPGSGPALTLAAYF